MPAGNKGEIFWRELVFHSDADTPHAALEEWEVTSFHHEEDETQCICTQTIALTHIVTHKTDTARQLIIGSVCIQKFFPAEQRRQAKKLENKERRTTRDCQHCNKRYNKEDATSDEVCPTCDSLYAKCSECDEFFRCARNERHWRKRCHDCYWKQTRPVSQDPRGPDIVRFFRRR